MYRVFSWKVIFVLIGLTIADMTLAPSLRVHMIQPIWVYGLILYTAFYRGGKDTLLAAFLTGLLRDLVSNPVIGMEALSLTTAALLLEWVVPKLDRKSTLMHVICALGFTAVAQFLVLVLACLSSRSLAMSWYSLGVVIRIAFYTACFIPFLFRILDALIRERQSFRQYELFR